MRTITRIIQKVQINIPFTMLYESYLETFIEYGLNPEIGLDAAALDRFSMADFSRIAEKFHKNSRTVTFHGPFIDLSAGSPDPAVRRITRQRLEQLLELVPLFKPLSVMMPSAMAILKKPGQKTVSSFGAGWRIELLSMARD